MSVTTGEVPRWGIVEGGRRTADLFVRMGAWMEAIGGSRPMPMPRSAILRFLANVAWGVWWATMLVLGILFGGGNAKFVYIDF